MEWARSAELGGMSMEWAGAAELAGRIMEWTTMAESSAELWTCKAKTTSITKETLRASL
jgi:hypothetical protein